MATIKEVARRANVSIATVSYVLNGTGAVSPQTRRAVREAAAALQYRPSYRGRALQSRRAMTIGLVLPATRRVAEPSFGELLGGITAGAARAGYHVLLATAPDDAADDLGPQLVETGRADGVVILDAQIDDARIAAARQAGIPYICAGRPGDDSPHVALDGVAGMLEAMAHLIVRGHSRIGLIQPPLEHALAGDLEGGYRESLAEAGLPFEPELIVAGGASAADGYAAAEDLLSLPERPTAIIAGTSPLAFGALHALHDQRLIAGRDIALISFEDSPAAAHTAPPLTAVRQPLHAWGEMLADGLIHLVGGGTWTSVLVPPQLIVRRSCGE
jgi:DNA-binding LacI/PurR family transcriptional regulator